MTKKTDLVDLVALSEKLAKSMESAAKSSHKLGDGLSTSNSSSKNGGGNDGGNPGGGAGATVASPSPSQLGFTGGGGGGGVLSKVLGVVGEIVGGVAKAGIGAMLHNLPSPAAAASYQLSTARQGAFSGMGFGQTEALQRSISAGGTAISSMDSVQAISNLQRSGIYNVGAVGRGVAALSNYEPGQGIAGAAGAAASFNQGSSVNRLATIGVQVRGANGLMRDTNQSANDFVNRIFETTPPLRNGTASTAYAYLIGALQPGNQLYYILQSYIQDDTLKQYIIDKLFAKAKGLPGNPTKDQLTSAGFLTSVTNAQSTLNTAKLGLTQATQEKINEGTAAALKTLTAATDKFSAVAAHLGPELKAYGFLSTMTDGLGSPAAAAIGGLFGLGAKGVGGLLKWGGKKLFGGIKSLGKKGLGLIKNLFGFGGGAAAAEEGAVAAEAAGGFAITDLLELLPLLFLEKGGPAKGKMPYIVGEKGPELFVPSSDGVVIPNHALGLNRDGGGGAQAGGASGFSQKDFALALLKGLGVSTSKNNNALNNVMSWETIEGGNWGNTAYYNPLNTSYQLNGSVNYNSKKSGSGVQAYNDWEQGITASVNTLTGAQADSRGYSAIVNGLKSGVGSAEFLKLLKNSAWDAGHYSTLGGLPSSSNRSSSSSSTADTSLPSSSDFIGSGYSWLKGKQGSGNAPIINISVNVPSTTDPHHAAVTAQVISTAVQKALKEAGVVKK